MTSIVVSVNPEVDGATQAGRDAFMAKLREAGVRHKVVILYPTQGSILSQAVAPQVAIRSGAIANPGSPLDHSAKVVLYAPGGAPVREKSGLRPAGEFADQWGPLLGGQGRGR